MARDSRNSVQFSAATIATKPAWLRAQLQGYTITSSEPTPDAPTRKPTSAPTRRRKAQGAKPECSVRPAPLEQEKREVLYPGRVSVVITSYRRRLLDPDNLCAKYFLDACRYSCLISDDRPEDITYRVGQEKVATQEEERTEILITPLP